jgi:hypothetical protein
MSRRRIEMWKRLWRQKSQNFSQRNKKTFSARGHLYSDPSEEQAKAYAKLPFTEYLKTRHWIRRRNQFLMSIGWHCSRCGQMRWVTVYHLCKDRLGGEWNQDLEALCIDCEGIAPGMH